MAEFNSIVKSEQELRDIIGLPTTRAMDKERSRLDMHCRAFIARSPFLLMATSGADGRCDVSPKGDVPGFVQVLDERRLVIPDRPGNKRIDGMRNLLENPHIGLILLVPGREETLRINGSAWITRDADLLQRCTVKGNVPALAVGVKVEECFLRCAKAFRRSQLWLRERWPEAGALPSLACVLFDQLKPEGITL
jgi:PPOX class probable FMN-dependent enzyme